MKPTFGEKVIIVAAICGIIGTFYYFSQPHQLGGIGSRAYPNHLMTPGLPETLSLADLTKTYTGNNCPNGQSTCTYSQYHRNVPQSEKDAVMKMYGNPTGKVEIDHFYPLCAGGSNATFNLWPEPEHVLVNGVDWGFHIKDKLEAYLCIQIKAGKINPKDAYAGITKDWIAYYNKLLGDPNKLGAISQPEDQDDN